VVTAFDRVHPVLDCVHGLGEALKQTADVQVVFMAQGRSGPRWWG
jgi:hypothetical protein